MEQRDTAVKERTDLRDDLRKPRRYLVYVLNDDFTPFDFVVMLMIQVFGKTEDEGWDIADHTHHEGKGFVGRYSYDMAKTKTAKATSLARENGYPLTFSTIPEDNNDK